MILKKKLKVKSCHGNIDCPVMPDNDTDVIPGLDPGIFLKDKQ